MEPAPYTPPPFMGNGHIQSIFPSLFRKVTDLEYTRERIPTPDGDFLDLDWAPLNTGKGPGSNKLAIISHGLEGCAHRAYVKGMARAVNTAGWDALAWNYRGCSGEDNATLRFYHNGATDDLAQVIQHAGDKGNYKEIALVGFSLGGNLSLVHLGRDNVDPRVSRAIVFSVPCDLFAAARTLALPQNRIYMKRFLRMLRGKIQAKAQKFPGAIDDAGYEEITDFKGFDDRYTAPIHGFKSAEDYWEQCSSIQYLPHINRPCRIINAMNDPFLSRECYPIAQAGYNENIQLSMPKSGGHVGFIKFNSQGRYWSEQQAVDFLTAF